MEYVCCKEYDRDGIEGYARFAVGSRVEASGNCIRLMGRKVCYVTSQSAHDHFARNDDGQGERRFSLTHGILAKVAEMKREYHSRLFALRDDPDAKEEDFEAIDKPGRFFDAMGSDSVFRGFLTNWYWNDAFFNAEIADLERLDRLLDEKMA